MSDAVTETPNEGAEVVPTDGAAIPETMRAVVQYRYGAADVLESADVAVPTPGPREVLVQVHAAGLDRGVVHLMEGLPYLVRFAGFGVRRPKQPILGFDVAGRVVAVGADVGALRVGDEVLGIARGGFAEYAVADVDKLALRPASVPIEAAAVTSISGITAHQGLHEVGRVREGQRVLVLGASGGVGTFAVQIAAAVGADVTGVASAAKRDVVRALGASAVFDYATTSLDELGGPFDLVLDINGRNSLRSLRRILTADGTLVVVGGEGGNRLTGGFGRSIRTLLWSPFVSQRLTMFIAGESRERVQAVVDLMAAGEITPHIGLEVPLDGVADAVSALQRGEVTGKALVRVGA